MLEIEIIEVSVTQMGFALMLKAPNREKVVPIFIGPLETYSISSALENQKMERPLTHDLMKEMLTSIGCQVRKVAVDDFKEGTFFAKLHIENQHNTKSQKIVEIDSRPSDAIAMAIRFRAPIFMSEQVYDDTAIDLDVMREKLNNDPKDDSEQFLDTLSESLGNELIPEEKKNDLIQSIIDEFNYPPEDRKTKVHSSKKSEQKLHSKEEVLKQMLQTAVSREQYEEAAKIRDELTSLFNDKKQQNKKRYKKQPNSKTKSKSLPKSPGKTEK